MTRFYGYVRDDEDARDHKFGVSYTDLVLPVAHDLTGAFPQPMDQGQASTCTVHAATAALRYNWINNDLPDLPLSRSQLYQDAGLIEGDTSDVGRQIRDVVAAMANKGVAREELWGYDKIGQTPPPEVYADALNHVALEYQRVLVDRQSINTAIFLGHPVIIGIPVFKQFESEEAAETGIIAMPGALDTEIGMHSMLHGAFGSRDKVLNSWSLNWGDRGYAYFPNEYIPKLGSDLWTVFINR